MCRGVRVVPRVHALGHPKRSAPMGSPAEPAHTRAPCAPDLHTMNEVWLLGCLYGPLTGPGLSGLRPLPPPWPPHTSKAGLDAPSMLSPPKQGKIIKRRTVNSFPTGLALCADPATVTTPPSAPQNKLQNSKVSRLSVPATKASVLTLGGGAEKVGIGRATPREGGPSLPYLHPRPPLQPLPSLPTVSWSRPPIPGPPLAHRVGKPRPGNDSRSFRRLLDTVPDLTPSLSI